MNGKERDILKVVNSNLEVVATDVNWIREVIAEIKHSSEKQVENCMKRFEAQDKKIEKNKNNIWKLIVCVAVISAGIGGGVSEIIKLFGG